MNRTKGNPGEPGPTMDPAIAFGEPKVDIRNYDGYAPIKNRPPGWYLLFRIGSCESCAEPVMTGNTLQLQPLEGESTLARYGLGFHREPPPAEYHSDAAGMCVCDRPGCGRARICGCGALAEPGNEMGHCRECDIIAESMERRDSGLPYA